MFQTVLTLNYKLENYDNVANIHDMQIMFYQLCQWWLSAFWTTTNLSAFLSRMLIKTSYNDDRPSIGKMKIYSCDSMNLKLVFIFVLKLKDTSLILKLIKTFLLWPDHVNIVTMFRGAMPWVNMTIIHIYV